jgi:hypothetical protein
MEVIPLGQGCSLVLLPKVLTGLDIALNTLMQSQRSSALSLQGLVTCLLERATTRGTSMALLSAAVDRSDEPH